MNGFKLSHQILLGSIFALLFTILFVALYYWNSSDRNLPRLDANETFRATRGFIITKDDFIASNSNRLYKVIVDSRSIDKNKLDLFIKLYCIYTGDSEKRVKETLINSNGTTVLSYKIDSRTAVHLKGLAKTLNAKKVFISFQNKDGITRPPIGMSVLQSGEQRIFTTKDSLTPIIGYTRKHELDGITIVEGVKGVEKYYEEYLGGVNNEVIKGPKDIGGNIILEKNKNRIKKTDGYDIRLNIPLRLQKMVEKIVDVNARKYNAKEIVVAIMNSKTGQILSLATNLRYDPGNIKKQDYEKLNFTATEYAYEVGSIIKPLVFTVAYEMGLVKPKDIINTYNGSYKLGQRTIKDSHPASSMSAEDVISHSSNIGMIMISSKLDGQSLRDGMLKFGLSQKTGIDLPYEQKGYLPPINILNRKVDKAVISYGYGLQVTFMQMLSAYNIFNNNGIMLTPSVVESLEQNGKKYSVEQGDVKQIISKETADIMKQILIKVVNEGTGKKAKTPGLEVGGKTGTARIAKTKEKGYSELYNSSFFGFANDNNATYTIGVLVREPKQGSYYAAQNALPIFKEIVDLLLEENYLHIDEIKSDEKLEKVKIKDEKLDEIKD